jgi:hypothetical protein
MAVGKCMANWPWVWLNSCTLGFVYILRGSLLQQLSCTIACVLCSSSSSEPAERVRVVVTSGANTMFIG